MRKMNARSSEIQLEGASGRCAYSADSQAAIHRFENQEFSFKVIPMQVF